MSSRFVWMAAAGLVLCIAAPAAAKPFRYHYKTPAAEVEFSWSSEAAEVPALVKRFRAELAKERAETIAGGKSDYAEREIGWSSVTKITTSGRTPRLLSLSREDWAFTGGAHGNGGTTALLWDRARNRELTFASLFSRASAMTNALRPAYCLGLASERKERRGDEQSKSGVPEFDACPGFSELAIIPGDADRDSRFDTIHLIAAPYVAGPYAEGEYDIALPVTGALIGALRPEFRASFEPQRQ